MTRMPFVHHGFDTDYRGEGYWRFSDARSAQSATSGRVTLGGQRTPRCPRIRH